MLVYKPHDSLSELLEVAVPHLSVLTLLKLDQLLALSFGGQLVHLECVLGENDGVFESHQE